MIYIKDNKNSTNLNKKSDSKISGIYSYKNLITGEIYVGQSHNIDKRYKDHLYKKESRLDKDIHKYGIENFEFKVEMCDLNDEELDYWEKQYIRLYESNHPGKGYNLTYGGKGSIGSSNQTAQLNVQDVQFIRECYAQHMPQKEIYEYIKDKTSFENMQHILEGKTWKNVSMDVYTPENKAFYKRDGFSYINENGLNGAEFTNDEVLELRKRYVNETAAKIYESVKDRCKFQTLQQILWGRNYKDIPIYDKKKKTWNN